MTNVLLLLSQDRSKVFVCVYVYVYYMVGNKGNILSFSYPVSSGKTILAGIYKVNVDSLKIVKYIEVRKYLILAYSSLIKSGVGETALPVGATALCRDILRYEYKYNISRNK